MQRRSQLSSWARTGTRTAKKFLERLESSGLIARSGREDIKDRIESSGTTCIQYSIIEKLNSDNNFAPGTWVVHKKFGNGEVIFSRPEFSKVKVLFNGVEHKISKIDLMPK